MKRLLVAIVVLGVSLTGCQQSTPPTESNPPPPPKTEVKTTKGGEEMTVTSVKD